MKRWTGDSTEHVTKSMLTRRISLEDFFAKTAQRRGKKKSREQRLADKLRRKEIEGWCKELGALAQSGDEWWHLMAGADQPDGMQNGGLALVRDGKIVWAEHTWLS